MSIGESNPFMIYCNDKRMEDAMKVKKIAFCAGLIVLSVILFSCAKKAPCLPNLTQLTSKGNGNYGYIDTIEEARKILVKQLIGTLITIAEDVKIQVEFNPANVGAYRLIGYENRVMRDEDFNNDAEDAGDIGAGHAVTAFYEIIPPGTEAGALHRRDPLKYAPPDADYKPEFHDELLTVKLRYKLPGESVSKLISFPVGTASIRKAGQESQDFRFAASVAGFGMLLRGSPYKGNADYDGIIKMA